MTDDAILPDDGRPLTPADWPVPTDPAMIEALDNQAPRATAPAAAAAGPAMARPEAARLRFVGSRPVETTVPLDFPFEHDGRLVEAITIRRLTVAEVPAVLDAMDGVLDRYVAYAAMCGLPAAVLRGLDFDDGERVTEIAHDFLPRFLRRDTVSSET